jgi:hypothetical protein
MAKSAVFDVGQKVKWTSQSGGYVKKKEGVVVFIIPSGKIPYDFIRGTTFSGDKLSTNPRAHQSYLVQIGRSMILYWPRVCHLKHG